MRFRRTIHLVSVCFAALLLIALFESQAPVGETAGLSSLAFQNQSQEIPDEKTHAFVVQFDDGAAKCRAATREEAPLMVPSPANRGIPISTLQGIATPISDSPTGLTINLVALSQLQNDANRNIVIAAFQRAADTWSARIKTPITITINVDYGFNMPSGSPFPAGVVGATSSGSVTVAYPTARANLRATVANPAESAIYYALPASSVPVNAGIGSAVEVSRSLGQALGFLPLDPNTAVATISFNKSFSFDFNPDNGISGSSLDFVGTATHEIGHALGFISNNGGGNNVPVTSWDLFRFAPGPTPATFPTAPRIMTAGGSQVFYTTQNFTLSGGPTPVLSLSTGGPDGEAGDGNQSSHWKDDDLTGQYIGIMDPTVDLGERMVTTENDFSALEILGWNLVGSITPPAPPPPPDNDVFADAFVLVGCGGTVRATNLNASRESGEPNHLSLSNNGAGTHSIWYQWQATTTGSVNFTTDGSAYDTVLAVYTGTSVNALSVVAQNDDIPDVPGHPHEVTSSVTFSVTAGTVYRIAIDGFNNGGDGGDMGTLKLNWFQGPCDEPARSLITETNNPNLIAAFDSVTFVRGPFHINTTTSLSSETRTRIMFLFNGLSFTPADNPDIVTIQAGPYSLFPTQIGAVTAHGFSATYVVVALADMAPGDYTLTVKVRGKFCTNSPILSIAGP